MRDGSEDRDVDNIFEKFDQLMEDLIHRQLQRACFRPWEIALLVDIAACNASVAALRQYQTAVRQQLANGARFPMKFSEYRRNARDTSRRGCKA